MAILSVQGLTKRYEQFTLKDVSFEVEQGYIMGFIGRNGAGKTTTMKSMLNLVHADAGHAIFFGEEFTANEYAIKQKIACMFGAATFYPKSKLSAITSVVRRFYDEWDDAAYARYLKRFDLDPGKRVEQLSEGMKVKYDLALALSHNAKLLILDEPTSGLDPVSRDDLLELFQELIEDGQRSILFSTQITSDLEKCADFITYIKAGEIVSSTDKDEFLESHRLVKGTIDQLTDTVKQKLIGYKKNAFGFTGLVRTAALPNLSGVETSSADIESIMIYYEKEHKDEQAAL